jgi:hypothetical protein
MSDERDDRPLDAALGEKPRGGLSPEERLEALRLEAAYLSLAAGADPVAPPADAKERLMTRVRADARRPAMGARLALAASLMALIGAAAYFLNAAPAARVADLAGEVTVDGRRLAAGDAVPAGAAVETAAGAWVNLRLDRRAVVRLKDAAGTAPGARLVLSGLKGPVSLRLERGALFSHVRTGTAFRVATPLAVAAVRGTVFYMQAEPERTYLCLCRGKIHVEGPAGARDLATEHHAALWAGPSSLEEAPMLGHTDDEAALLALP